MLYQIKVSQNVNKNKDLKFISNSTFEELYLFYSYKLIFFTEEVIVIPGGFTDVSISEVEVYSPIGGCQHKVIFRWVR